MGVADAKNILNMQQLRAGFMGRHIEKFARAGRLPLGSKIVTR
jgi:hypothetical protein